MTESFGALLDPRRILNPIYRYLDENGNGSGNKNANGNYAGSPTRFFIQPPADEVFFLNRMIVLLEDGGSIDAGGWGNGAALTNGVECDLRDPINDILTDLFDGLPLLTNAGWAQFCYDVRSTDFGAGNNYLGVRWTFTKSGRPLVLRGSKQESFGITFNDNVTNVVRNTFMVQGYTRSWRM